MSATPTTRLYELALANGIQPSPFVWRIRFALAHKQVPYEGVPMGFTDIPRVVGPTFRLVPVLEDHKGRRGESWEIVEHLDQEYPQHPLFSSPAEKALARFVDAWITWEIMPRFFSLYALDLHNAARPGDQAYYRSSREGPRTHGKTLEDFTAGREQRLPEVRAALLPLRQHLVHHAFLHGNVPGYADYIALGAFLWAASAATLPLLTPDDPIKDWLERGRDLHGGVARDPRLKPLW